MGKQATNELPQAIFICTVRDGTINGAINKINTKVCMLFIFKGTYQLKNLLIILIFILYLIFSIYRLDN